MKKIIFNIAIAILFLTGFNACKPDKVTLPGTFALHLHTNLDTNEVAFGTVYLDSTGRQIQLSVAQMYISNIRLKKTDGTFYTITGATILKTIDPEEYIIGSAPAGNYLSVSFDVGVQPTDNHIDPNTFPDTSALHTTDANAWYGNTTDGYIFLNIQGMVDTSANNNGAVNFPVSYEIGTDVNLKTVNMPDQAFTIPSQQTQLVHIICDYGRVLTGIDFKTQPNTTTFTNASVATQIANNITGHMFRYEYQ